MSFIHQGAGEPHRHDHAWQAHACMGRRRAAAEARAAIAQAAAKRVAETTDEMGKLELLIARYGAAQVKPGGTEAYDGEDTIGGVAEDVFWKRVYALREAEQETRAYEAKMLRDTELGF